MKYYLTNHNCHRVSVDIDVPLFLPLNGERRLRDLRSIAMRENRDGFRMNGQLNFDSGWEWGYWLNDVVTARAAWNPRLDLVDPWSAFRNALSPFVNIYDQNTADDRSLSDSLTELLVDFAQAQERLLLRGEVNGRASPDLRKLSGFGYVQGTDTWTDLPRLFGLHLLQPDKVHLRETSDPLWPHVVPLLSEMEHTFSDLFTRMQLLYDRAVVIYSAQYASPEHAIAASQALDFLDEITDCFELLKLRIMQVRRLYQSRDPQASAEETASLQTEARGIILHATTVVRPLLHCASALV